MTDLTGKDIGRYHVIERLGQGGMAEVYKAFDTRLDREVAIKVIRKDAIAPAHHEMMMKRFEREAKALARLSHPNIVKVHDFGEFDGAPYLVMEYLTGGTLSLKACGKTCEWQEAAGLLAPIARALEYAHEEGVLHRDVKPANILLTRRGQPMLSDFGIAKILDSDSSTQLTGTNMGIGTPEYMAPEQWLGKPVPQTDIYSLGVVFYELVTGRRPYTADTPAAVMLKQASDALPRPTEFNANLPGEVEQVLFKALARNPQDRYASMAEFALVLERLAVGQLSSDSTQAMAAPQPLDQTQVALPGERKTDAPTTATPPAIQTQGVSTPTDVVTEPVTTISTLAVKKKNRWLVPVLISAGVIVIAVALILVWSGITNRQGQIKATVPAAINATTPTVEQVSVLQATTTETPSPTATQQVDTPTLPAKKLRISKVDSMLQAWVPEGEFSMGSDAGDPDEKPVHTVYLDGFWIDWTEVTNGMYSLCVNAGACTAQGNDTSNTRLGYSNSNSFSQYPVLYVSWDQANQYCRWAGRRLPTEAEWEKAGRGTDARTYPWGEDVDCSKANYAGCKKDTTVAGSYPDFASPFGALDMAGNVWEWVADWYSENYYASSPGRNPMGPSSGDGHVIRGGSWFEDAWGIRLSNRSKGLLGQRGNDVGFRCASSK